MKKIRCGIVGFRGYSGAELVRLLDRHSQTVPVLMEHRSDATARPQPRGVPGPETVGASAEAAKKAALDCVFLATPPEVSMEIASPLLALGIRVVDLSGAFRLKNKANYTRWYKEEHSDEKLLEAAVYGLPEFYREQIRGQQFISNPGCYPTAANLALRPLLQAGVIDRSAGVVCDAKSGVSGAGRKASLKTSFCEVTENFSAYGFMTHRHVPEVLQNSGLEESEFTFTAQLLPVDRGILETIYVRAKGDLLDVYASAYEREPFVRIYNAGEMPDLQAVQRTNFCDIGVLQDKATGRALIVAAEDNLVKGAAGQAVQNMNLMFDFAETEGLL
jgi:N-acetyl-gamma-glutamyl-phosphate reductase